MKELFENVLTAGFYGSVVILAVMLLRLVLKRTPKRVFRVLWLLAFLRLLMPFEIPSPLSLQPEPGAIAQQPWGQSEENLLDPLADFYPELIDEPVEAAHPATHTAQVHSAPVESIPASTPQPTPKAKMDPVTVIAALWLGVGAAFLLYSLYTYLRLRFQVREAIKIPGGFECEGIQTAFILGYFRPRVYIPMGMSLSNQSYILAHERTHLQRGDHWLKLLGYIALAVHWYHPLVWLAYVLYCKDIELACDEQVVRFMDLEERKHYSAALLKCSAGRAHFAACPVAFGEVSVKTRIQSVLNYRKPGFWISLCGVAAIAFVAVCLMTNPTDKENPSASHDGEKGFASDLPESEIAYTCQKAMEELLKGETFCVRLDSQTVADSGVALPPQTLVSRQAGASTMTLFYHSNTGEMYAGFFVGEEKNATCVGDAWVESDVTSVNPRNSMEIYSPAGKTVTFPAGTGIISPDSVAYAAQWSGDGKDYSGVFTYTFHSDGTLASIDAEYSYQVDGGMGNRVSATVTVMEEDPADTRKKIQACGERILTDDELFIFQKSSDRVTEVPSNTLPYDKDYDHGSEQMGWRFLDGGWYFAFGAVDATPTGLTLAVEISANFQNDNVLSATVSPEGNYFLEKLENGVWTTVTPKTEGALPQKVMDAGDRVTVDWTDVYGTLSPGFYRIGSCYTATSSDGATDTQVCYAKFRLRDAEADALLLKCKEALSNLLNSDSYHVRVINWNNLYKYSNLQSVESSEVWKSGKDYLDAYESRRVYDNSLTGSGGVLYRDGVSYFLTWGDGGSSGEITDWEVNTYYDEDDFQLFAAYPFELYDSIAYDVVRQENDILVIDTTFSDDSLSRTEVLFRFFPDGRLAGVVKTNIWTEEGPALDAEIEVMDTSPEEIRQHLDSLDVTTPGVFSWKKDQLAYPEDAWIIGFENFKNTSPVTISTPLDAISRALRDCDLPEAMGLDPGTNKSRAFYDEDARMWKVEFTASWDDRIYQAVYMTNEGVTVRTVTLELEADY